MAHASAPLFQIGHRTFDDEPNVKCFIFQNPLRRIHKIKAPIQVNGPAIKISHFANLKNEQICEMRYFLSGAIVYYTEVKIKKFSDMMELIPELGAECMELNPDMKCSNPPYEFCEYLDDEHREENITIRHNEAVDKFGKEA